MPRPNNKSLAKHGVRVLANQPHENYFSVRREACAKPSQLIGSGLTRIGAAVTGCYQTYANSRAIELAK